MTRAQFLNDLYHRLGELTQEQAEQHLTYYAEMLADRMEEGMTEEEAVASMEDINTIAKRILQDEEVSGKTAQPPRYLDLPKPEAPASPPKKQSGISRAVQISLWILAFLVAGGVLLNKFSDRHRDERVVDRSSTVEQSDNTPGIRVGPDGIYVNDGEKEVSIGPSGIQVGGEDVSSWEWENGWDASDWDYAYGGEDYEIDASGIEEVKVDWIAGLVCVGPIDAGVIQFREDSTEELTEKTKLSYKIEDKTLHINFRKDQRTTGFSDVYGAKQLTLLLPGSLVADLDVETTSARVLAIDLQLPELDVETTSGEVQLSGVSAESVDISTTSGNISLSDVSAQEIDIDNTSGSVNASIDVQKLDVETISGDVALYASSGRAFELDSVSGDLLLSVEGRGVSEIKMKTTSGDMALGLDEELDFTLTYETISGSLNTDDFSLYYQNQMYVNGSGSCKIDVESTSGDLTLMRN